MLPKGHKIKGPDGQGYTLTRDLHVGEIIALEAFEAFGGAPEPKAGHSMPDWLARHFWPIGSVTTINISKAMGDSAQ